MTAPAPLVKFCGLTEEDAVEAAAGLGADMIGFVFFEKSPRYVSPERCAELVNVLAGEEMAENGPRIVALFVDPTDAELESVFLRVRPDIVQLHGTESPERVEFIRQEYGVEVIKAFGVATQADLDAARAYDGIADYLLFDAKAPAGAERPGGNAQSFPWGIMKSWTGASPWLLAGGLTPETVARALAESGAPGVDVSSGVETAPGEKDPEKMAAFIDAVDAA